MSLYKVLQRKRGTLQPVSFRFFLRFFLFAALACLLKSHLLGRPVTLMTSKTPALAAAVQTVARLAL